VNVHGRATRMHDAGSRCHSAFSRVAVWISSLEAGLVVGVNPRERIVRIGATILWIETQNR